MLQKNKSIYIDSVYIIYMHIYLPSFPHFLLNIFMVQPEQKQTGIPSQIFD